MKLNIDEEERFKKELEDNINHAHAEGLPITSIELDETEWGLYLCFRQRLVNGKMLELTPSQKKGICEYMGVEIRKGL